MKGFKITLEDKGQDFLEFYLDEPGIIVKVEPLQEYLWKGGIVPIMVEDMVKVGELCPIHHPPHLEYSYLNYKIEKIEPVHLLMMDVVDDNESFSASCDEIPGWVVTQKKKCGGFESYIKESVDFYIDCAKKDGDELPETLKGEFVICYNITEAEEEEA